MMKNLLTLALAACVTTVALAQSPSQTAAKPEAAKSKVLTLIQGAWLMTTTDGQEMNGGPEVIVTITNDKYVQTVAGDVVERGSFKIDESKKPMTLDLFIAEGNDAGKTQVGVIEVTDTTMRGKLNATPGDTTRPADFAPADGFFAFTATKKK